MYTALIEKKQIVHKKLNLRQDLFCKYYATDPSCLGIAVEAYKKAYPSEKSIETVRVASANMVNKPEITARINEYLTSDGFNNESVDITHNFLIHQKKDLTVAMKGIEHYNKLKKRIENKLEIVLPRPILGLEEDSETVRMVDDKKKAVDVSYTETQTQVE